jgi:hypothetical protein
MPIATLICMEYGGLEPPLSDDNLWAITGVRNLATVAGRNADVQRLPWARQLRRTLDRLSDPGHRRGRACRRQATD